jgi:hypothetical protein
MAVKKFFALPIGVCQVATCVGGKLLQGSDLGQKPSENPVKKSTRDSAGQRG